MADDPQKQDAQKLPPKLNLRKQGILKQDPPADAQASAPARDQKEDQTTNTAPTHASGAPSPANRSTSRLVVKPLATQSTDEATNKSEPEANAESSQPVIEIKPLTTKATTTEENQSNEESQSPVSLDAKRKTSRIPLETARPIKSVSGDESVATKPKTIKIKPSAPVPRMRTTQPLNITIPIAEESSAQAAASDAEKRKTSRIPLDEALTADKESTQPAEAIDPTRPKTIKIKRPGSESSPTSTATPPPAKMAEADLSKTARLDHLPIDEMGAAQAHKKTIRVKRPDASATPAPAATPRFTPPEPIENGPTDEPGAIWAVTGLAAALVLCVVIYMFAAQAMGPNTSGTALSSWTGGPNLAWPGKIMK